MNAGRLEQVGTPAEIYDRPLTRFVAEFIGEINLIDGVLRDGRFTLSDGRAVPAPVGKLGAATLALRPERARLVGSGEGALDGTVADASFLGDQVLYTVDAGGRRLFVKERNPGGTALRAIGTAVGLAWSADAGVLIGPQ
jgi:putative spermidine/putrescine transport system ATP-binding protein